MKTKKDFPKEIDWLNKTLRKRSFRGVCFVILETFLGHPVTNSEVSRLMSKQADKLMKRGDEVKIDFEDIYESFFKDVYLFVLSMSGNPAMAEEVTQETFFRALKEIDNFKGNCSVKSWLCQIAKNLYIDDIRRRKRYETVKTDLAGKSREEGNAETAAIRQEEVISIYKALHCLEEPYKEVFSLRTLGDLSYREIGEVFEKSESWARVTYHRAKLKIREQLM